MRPRPASPALFPYTTLFRSPTAASTFTRSNLTTCRTGPSLALRLVLVHPVTSCSSPRRSEDHTSELQSQFQLVCRLLLEKTNTPTTRGPDAGAVAANSHGVW